MKLVLVVTLLLSSTMGCARSSDPSTRQAEDPFAHAMSQGDYRKAIDLMRPKALAGDAEYEFTVGRLQLEWIADPEAKEPPQHSESDALVWIYKAARAGVPQAAETLRSGYEWGRYSLPKNKELETCWRKVEGEEQSPDVCLAAEAKFKQK